MSAEEHKESPSLIKRATGGLRELLGGPKVPLTESERIEEELWNLTTDENRRRDLIHEGFERNNWFMVRSGVRGDIRHHLSVALCQWRLGENPTDRLQLLLETIDHSFSVGAKFERSEWSAICRIPLSNVLRFLLSQSSQRYVSSAREDLGTAVYLVLAEWLETGHWRDGLWSQTLGELRAQAPIKALYWDSYAELAQSNSATRENCVVQCLNNWESPLELDRSAEEAEVIGWTYPSLFTVDWILAAICKKLDYDLGDSIHAWRW